MKTQKRQVTITDLYNLVAHETVSLLEAVDDNAIPLALEMREGLTMLAAAAGSGEGVETHLEWIDQEIENLKQTAGTPQCVTHLIPTSQLVRTVAIDAQIDMTLEFFRIVAETPTNRKPARSCWNWPERPPICAAWETACLTAEAMPSK